MPTGTQLTTLRRANAQVGTVQSYDHRRGYGYIVSDDAMSSGRPFLLLRQHLRSPFAALALAPGRRVIFTATRESGRLIATDVRPEADDLESQQDSRESVSGTITRPFEEEGYAFIRLLDGRSAFCHISNVTDSTTIYPQGTAVQCDIIRNAQGWRALDVTRADPFRTNQGDGISSRANKEILAQAILARDNKEYDRARELYKKGMSDAPSVQLVLSYAAFEKNQNNKEAALDAYRRGIAVFPKVAKLREDAGVLAGNMGRTNTAVSLLSSALDLCRNTEQAGELGALLALARLHARGDTNSSRQRALSFYRQATALRPVKSLPGHDQLNISLIEIRLQHHRGDLTYRFLQRCGFDVTMANLLSAHTTGADLIARIENAEISESYGISGTVLVRCMFKQKLAVEDIEALDKTIEYYATRELISTQMALLVLSSVPDDLKEIFFKRIERRDENNLIVPVAQEVMETTDGEEISDAAAPFDALRTVLNTWLYRRDLFARTYPVFGKRFFGRDRILAELKDAIVSARPSGIFGLRKVGKTSLLKECERRATASGDIVVYVDLLRVPAGVNYARWLYWRIANLLHEQTRHRAQTAMRWRLGGQWIDYLDLPDSFPVEVAFDADLSALIRSTAATEWGVRPRVVVLLDEIERILPTNPGDVEFQGLFEFLSYLRGFAQETQDLAIIVTGANPSITEISQFNGRDNPVFNFFQEIYLQLLEPDEAGAMMHGLGRGMGVKFVDSACDRIVELTGGHPYFAREFCSFLAREYRERPLLVTTNKVESVVEGYLEQVGAKDFREIMDRLGRDYPKERDVCVELAKAANRTPTRGRLKHLVGYQLVKMRGNQPFLTMDLFRRWILEWS